MENILLVCLIAEIFFFILLFAVVLLLIDQINDRLNEHYLMYEAYKVLEEAEKNLGKHVKKN
jgi:hypothetical protein